MYGRKESISVKECRKFKEFFKLLQVDFVEESEDERVSLKRGNIENFSDRPGGKTTKLKKFHLKLGTHASLGDMELPRILTIGQRRQRLTWKAILVWVHFEQDSGWSVQ